MNDGVAVLGMVVRASGMVMAGTEGKGGLFVAAW